ncbi:dicarboxylate/amino acid:cation symporter [Endozoicomonas arenosclerae]|uniref:dicarboxylate/amino acid:cation symporter n=1 Tax=Endozoicomonas arenosclerae TaxID=1633495 RepID=UPI0007861963|nr:dicarboxylate/amino acid:cation symporter [Endozoicomonas arenosclerae]
MCDSHRHVSINSPVILFGAAVLGLFCGWLDIAVINQICDVIADIFIRLLKLVSLPIIFFSLVATLSGMSGMADVRSLGGRVIKYTLLTTLLSASLALGLYLLLDPSESAARVFNSGQNTVEAVSYWNHLLNIIPSNLIEPFLNNNVMGVLFLALVFSASILSLGEEHKKTLNQLFESLFAAVMKMTGFFLKLMPLAVWAFVTLFVKDVQNHEVLQGLAIYLLCVVLANLIQAGVILPALLKIRGVAPVSTLKAMWPALTIAFFSKSSSAALPSAVDCAERRLGLQRKVARFSMPLCITVNMNACAAYILITVLFVSQSNGVQFTSLEMFSWILVATIAAIGNAGVPMGCYMLSSAFLAAMGVDMQLMVLILPFYAFIDMLESAINVWSDSCVTAMVNQELVAEREQSLEEL